MARFTSQSSTLDTTLYLSLSTLPYNAATGLQLLLCPVFPQRLAHAMLRTLQLLPVELRLSWPLHALTRVPRSLGQSLRGVAQMEQTSRLSQRVLLDQLGERPSARVELATSREQTRKTAHAARAESMQHAVREVQRLLEVNREPARRADRVAIV